MTDYKTFLDNGINDFYAGNYTSALENINKSLDLKNDWEIPFFYRGVVNQALENFDDAILDYTKALKINDKMTDAYYNRAKIELSRKDNQNRNMENIISDLGKALELDPNFMDALFAMAAALEKEGRYEEAITYLDRIIDIDADAVFAKAFKKLIIKKHLSPDQN